MEYDEEFNILQNKFYNAFLENYNKNCFRKIKEAFNNNNSLYVYAKQKLPYKKKYLICYCASVVFSFIYLLNKINVIDE